MKVYALVVGVLAIQASAWASLRETHTVELALAHEYTFTYDGESNHIEALTNRPLRFSSTVWVKLTDLNPFRFDYDVKGTGKLIYGVQDIAKFDKFVSAYSPAGNGNATSDNEAWKQNKDQLVKLVNHVGAVLKFLESHQLNPNALLETGYLARHDAVGQVRAQAGDQIKGLSGEVAKVGSRSALLNPGKEKPEALDYERGLREAITWNASDPARESMIIAKSDKYSEYLESLIAVLKKASEDVKTIPDDASDDESKVAKKAMDEADKLMKELTEAAKKVRSAARATQIIVNTPGEDERPVTVEGDLFAVKVSRTVTPGYAKWAKDNGLAPSNPDSTSTYIRTCGRTVLDTSLGLTATNLKATNYYKDSANKIQLDVQDHSDISPAAFLTYIPSTSSRGWSNGYTLGTAALSDNKFALFAGLSLTSTSESHMTITIGLVNRPTQRLGGGQTLGQDIGAGSVNLKSVTRTGLFIGVGFKVLK